MLGSRQSTGWKSVERTFNGHGSSSTFVWAPRRPTPDGVERIRCHTASTCALRTQTWRATERIEIPPLLVRHFGSTVRDSRETRESDPVSANSSRAWARKQ
jgi:hypothetical protein